MVNLLVLLPEGVAVTISNLFNAKLTFVFINYVCGCVCLSFDCCFVYFYLHVIASFSCSLITLLMCCFRFASIS